MVRDQPWCLLTVLAAEIVPGAQVKVLGDAGHSSYFESPELFNETVSHFLEESL